MPSSPLRVALFGFGASTKIFHLPFLAASPQRFAVVAVLDRRAEDAPRLVPQARVHSTWQSLVDDADYDLGIVTLPNALHAEVATRILASGRHVVVEKPLTVTTAEADAVLEAARLHGRTAFVFQSRRLDSDFLLIRDVLEHQKLGRLVRAEIRMDRWSNSLRKKAWKETGEVGSSLLEDLGSHLLDQALQLWGRPQSLQCRTGVQRDGSGVVDAFRISLEYPGLWVDLESSLVARHTPYHWLLHGTAGSLIKTGVDVQESQLTSGLAPSDARFGWEPAEQSAVLVSASGERTVLSPPQGHYGRFYDDVWTTLREGGTTAFAASQGRDVVELLELARRSAALAQTLRIS